MAMCQNRLRLVEKLDADIKRCVIVNSDEACKGCSFPKAACVCAPKNCPVCDNISCICD